MRILSHRGYWKVPEEKNSQEAFIRSFKLGFGVETDVRDCAGRLVISHDAPSGSEMTLDEFLELANLNSHQDLPLTIALNIKADGLSLRIEESLALARNINCFVFDMSVPDMRSYLGGDVPVFTRMSEVERAPAWLENADGVWLDSFNGDWFATDDILDLLQMNKSICIVSPELHGRPRDFIWSEIKRIKHQNNLMLCTDFPEEAQQYFELNLHE